MLMKSGIRAIRFINAHKILAAPIIIGMMYWFHNCSTEAFLYLGLHGTYATLWLVKSVLISPFPSVAYHSGARRLTVFLLLGTYYIAPYLLLSRHKRQWRLELGDPAHRDCGRGNELVGFSYSRERLGVPARKKR